MKRSQICVNKKWLLLTSEWQPWIWLAISLHRIMQNWHWEPVLNLCKHRSLCSKLIFPSGNRIHSPQHLKAFLGLLFSTFNVPKCALMNRSTRILPVEADMLQCRGNQLRETLPLCCGKTKEEKAVITQLCHLVKVEMHVMLPHTANIQKLQEN